MDATEQIKAYKEIIETKYLEKITTNLRNDLKYIEIDFNDITKHNPDLAEILLNDAEEGIKTIEIAIDTIQDDLKVKVLLKNLPGSTKIPISELTDQLNRFITIEGLIMKPSDLRTRAVSGSFECPNCLPKGTLVLNSDGKYKPIEISKEIICMDYDFKPTISKTKIIDSGIKQIWEINNEIKCSADHKWFVYRNGVTKVIQTKHLNKGDIIYKINDKEVYNLQQTTPKIQISTVRKEEEIYKVNLFKRMQRRIFKYLPKRWSKAQIRQQRDNKIIYPREEINQSDSGNIRHKIESQNYKTQTHKIWDKIKDTFRTNEDKCKKLNYLQAWKEMWGERISKISKEIPSMEMHQMWHSRRNVTIKGFISTPHKSKPFRPQNRKSDGSMSITPLEVTSINQTIKNTQMYDLIVPRYNNFIISSGIITHNCGNLIKVLMLSHEYRTPQRCACGRKGKFRELSKDLEKTMSFEVMEETDPNKKSIKKPSRRKVFLAEPLTNHFEEFQPGKKVIIHGWLELEEQFIKGRMGKQSNEFKTNIIANNIKVIERSWDAIKLTKKDKDKCQEMAQKTELLDEFAQSMSPEFEAYTTLRQTLILQLVGGQRIYNKQGQMKERECIHLHLVGDSGTGKSVLQKALIRICPINSWASGKGMTGAGLTGAMVRDEYGQFVFDAGPVLTNSGGIVGIDEFDKINKEDFGYMANIMAEEIHKVVKASVDMEFEAKTSILSASNPLHGRFIEEDSIIKQFAPIPKFIIDRFDIAWVMRENVDDKKITEKYMALHMGDDSVDPIYTIKEMQKYIAYARRLKCIIKRDEALYFNEQFYKLTGKTADEGKESSRRILGSLMRFVYAHCKFTSVGLENENNEILIRKKDIDYSFSVKRYSFELLGVTNQEGFVSFEDIEMLPKQKEINKYYLVKGMIKKLNAEIKNKGVEEEKILEECKKENPNFTDDDLEKELARLNKIGDIFNPKGHTWAMLL